MFTIVRSFKRHNIAAACRRGLALGLLFSCAGLASLIAADDTSIWDLIYYDINEINQNIGELKLDLASNFNVLMSDIYNVINHLSLIYGGVIYGMEDVKDNADANRDEIINKLEEISGYTWDVFVVNWPDDNDFSEDIISNVESINNDLNDLINDLIIALEQNIGNLQLQLELEFDSLSLDMNNVIYFLSAINNNTHSTFRGIDNLTDLLKYDGVYVNNYNQSDLLSGLESIMSEQCGNDDIIDVFDEWDNDLTSYDPPHLYEPDLDEFSTVSGIVYSATDAYRSVQVDSLEYEMEGQSVLDDIDFSGDFEDQTLMGNIRSVVDKIMPLPVEISSMYWSLAIPDGVSIFGDVEVIRLVDISASDLQLMSVVRNVSGLIYVALGIFVLVRGLR